MQNQKQIINQAKQVKKYMKQHNHYFIRNNERYRKELGINQHRLSDVLKYLNKIGFLESWNHKIYQIKHKNN